MRAVKHLMNDFCIPQLQHFFISWSLIAARAGNFLLPLPGQSLYSGYQINDAYQKAWR
jgi:hypothetical protein